MATKKDAEAKAAEEAEAAKAEEAEAAKVEEAEVAEPKTYKPGDQLGQLIATTAGLPNTCAATGAKIAEDYWFAAHEDAARSGQGFCQAHAEKLAAEEPAK